MTKLSSKKFLQNFYDFIYVDGPANRILGSDHACVDSIHLTLSNKPKTIAFDWRNSSFNLAATVFEKEYKKYFTTIEDFRDRKIAHILNNKENPFLDITGIGEVRANKWYKEMGIKSIAELKDQINKGVIKTTHHIDIGLKYYDDFKQLIPRSEIDDIKKIIKQVLKKLNKKYIFEICGSYRRGNPKSGDIDVLVTLVNNKNEKNKNKEIKDIKDRKEIKDSKDSKKTNSLKSIVTSLKNIGLIVDELTENGNTKFMGVCRLNSESINRRLDIRFVNYENYYSSLIYFTGNKNFNVSIRKKALQLGMSINEYGIKRKDGTNTIINSEKEIFDILGIEFVEPEKRNYL
jgi:DNA polymerase/3'-5' exonuclease PolX